MNKRYSIDDDQYIDGSNTTYQSQRQVLNYKTLVLAIDENYSDFYYPNANVHSNQKPKKCEQYLNSRCISKYEVQRDLYELVLTRIREGFTLRKICANTTRDTMSVYLLRYYTQTCCFIYKISYTMLLKRNLNVELWLVYNYLNIKSNYQNSVLLQSIRNTISEIQVMDKEKRFDVQKTLIPEILQHKIPLFVFKKTKYELNGILVKPQLGNSTAQRIGSKVLFGLFSD